MTKSLVVNGGVYESEIGGGSSTGYLIWNHPRMNMNDFGIENLSEKRLTRLLWIRMKICYNQL